MKRKPFSHLTYEKRIIIKEMHDHGKSAMAIAEALNVSHQTIYRELKRGTVEGKYSPEEAEKQYRNNLSEKGARAFFELHPEIADTVANLILNEHLSVTQICERLKLEITNQDIPTTPNSLYAAIDRGFIPGVTRDSLKRNQVMLSKEGTICVPKWAREQMGIEDGVFFTVEVEGSSLVFTVCKNE